MIVISHGPTPHGRPASPLSLNAQAGPVLPCQPPVQVDRPLHRRDWLARAGQGIMLAGTAGLISAGAGCLPPAAPATGLVRIFGSVGDDDGQFRKPRAVVLAPTDELFIVDFTGRIQVFDLAGEFLRGWRTPNVFYGKPCGLGWSRDGHLIVADTHYFRVLFYRPDGTLNESRTIGGEHGSGPGEFAFLTDVVQDRQGRYYVGEYGENDRVQVFDAEGRFISQFGGHGDDAEAFLRPQALTLDADGRLWIADACNHRIKVYDIDGPTPKLLTILGREGREPGEFRYPYGLEFDPLGRVVIAEFGNNRIQVLSPEGQPLTTWGSPGTHPGQLHQPWGLAVDRTGLIHVLDSYNHRVQSVRLTDTVGS